MANGYLYVESQEAFDKWIASQTPTGSGGASFE
jgi:hypothetical protein